MGEGAQAGQARDPFPHLLPPGHAPGPQSRRARRRRAWAPILTGFVSVPLLVGAVAILATGDPAQSKTKLLAGLLVVLAVPSAALAVWLWRRPRNLQAKFIELSVDRTEVRRGDRIMAVVRVLDPARVNGPVQAGLVCTEFWDRKVHTSDAQGNSVTVRSTAREEVLSDWRDIPNPEEHARVQFTVPPDAPFSYEGDAVSWAWRVVARVAAPRRSDPHRDVAVWVSP